MSSPIGKINAVIQSKRDRREEIMGTIRTLKMFQNDLGSQNVIGTITVLIRADKKLKGQIDYLKKRVNKLHEQPRC